MNEEKKAILVFELGHLQVFHYQTSTEWFRRIPPSEYYWQKRGDFNSYGPFLSVYDAVNDYTKFIAIKTNIEPLPDNVITVDFKSKKRITQTKEKV